MLQSIRATPPQPLLEPRPDPLDYPVAALGDLLGPAVDCLAQVIGVPRAMAAQSVLATSALVTQGHANVHLDGRVYPLSLYLLTIAGSGSRKSAVDRQALQAARDWERLQWMGYRDKLRRYRVELARQTAGSDKESADDPASALEPPPAPRLIASEPTIEALVKSLAQDLPCMGLFNDEGGQFLGSSTMNKDNRLKAITQLSSLWDGNSLDRARSAASESLRAYDRRLSLHLMLQPCLATPLLRDPLIQGQGIFGRCLVAWPQSLVGQRFYNGIDLTQEPAMQRYHQRITALLHQPWALQGDGGLQLRALRLSPFARNGWIELHDTIEAQLGEFGELASVQTSAARAAENVLRIAGIFAVLEEYEVIEVAHIQRASTLMEYYLIELQRLTEQEQASPHKEDADRLLRWLQQRGWSTFSLRELSRGGPRFARKSAKHTATLLAQLISHHWLSGDGQRFEVRHVPPE